MATITRASRAADAVKATVEFMSRRDGGADGLNPAERFLLRHWPRPDGDCACCLRPYPCSLIGIARRARRLAALRDAKATRRLAAGGVDPSPATAVTEALGGAA